MERWDKGGVTEGWRQRGWGETESAKSNQRESRRILKQVNNLKHLSCSSLSISADEHRRFIQPNQNVTGEIHVHIILNM